jgi:hypothetical protein
MKSTRRGKRDIPLPIFKNEPMGRNNGYTQSSAIQRAVAQMQPEAQNSMGEITLVQNRILNAETQRTQRNQFSIWR